MTKNCERIGVANRAKSMRAARRGFTLLEMMLVVLIMGILGGVAVFGAKGVLNASRVNRTVADLRTIKSNVELYNGRFGEYPPTLQALTVGTMPLMDKIPKDAWLHEYIYIYPGTSGDPNKPYDLYSQGKSVVDQSDDISIENMDNQ